MRALSVSEAMLDGNSKAVQPAKKGKRFNAGNPKASGPACVSVISS